jgi:hypothetical protein
MARRKPGDRLPIDNGDGTFRVPMQDGSFAIIDACDVANVSLFTWHRRVEPWGQEYALANFRHPCGISRMIRMHRLILCFPLMSVDHIDRCGLNNRRDNLRLCDDKQNQGNSGKNKPGKYSIFKGVTKHMPTGHWKVQLTKNRKMIYCTYHRDELEAARAYDAAAIAAFGEFACTNAALGLIAEAAK